MKTIRIVFPIFLLTACIQTSVLKDGISKIPTNPNIFKNKIHFDKSILNLIDTTAIYEEYETYYVDRDNSIKILSRLNYQNPRSIYAVYKFYGNGRFNLFHIDKEEQILTNKMFDPNYTGFRGVLYKQNDKIKGDLITQISGMGAIGMVTEIFHFKGDTVFVHAKNRWDYIFIKRKIPNEILNFQAEW